VSSEKSSQGGNIMKEVFGSPGRMRSSIFHAFQGQRYLQLQSYSGLAQSVG
jgi:hypothetical protein